MENCSTPVPLPKLKILQDSELRDKKSSLKKQRLSATKSCPRVPSKGIACIRSRLYQGNKHLLTPQLQTQSLTNSPYASSSPCKVPSTNSRCRSSEGPSLSPINNHTVTKLTNETNDDEVCPMIKVETIPGCQAETGRSFKTVKPMDLEDLTPNSSLNSTRSSNSSSCCEDDLATQILSNIMQVPYRTPRVNPAFAYLRSNFELLSKLGSGSFGEVFKVRDIRSRQLFALKKSRERFRGKMDRTRKLGEVRKLEQTGRHRHCVRFYHAWEESNFLFIQTELCSTTLLALIIEGDTGSISEEETWMVLIDMLHALRHLAQHKLIHLDIKPDNIFVTLSPSNQSRIPTVYKLGDFGLMINYEKDSINDAQEGDSRYLALELLSETYTPAADIFSLGATLLDCVTSIEMPKSGTWWQLLRDGLTNLPEQFSSQMSRELFQILDLMMHKDYKKRPSAADLLTHIFLEPRDTERQQSLMLLDTDFEVSPMKRLKLDHESPQKPVDIVPEQELDLSCERTTNTDDDIRTKAIRGLAMSITGSAGQLMEHDNYCGRTKTSEHQSPPEREERASIQSMFPLSTSAPINSEASSISVTSAVSFPHLSEQCSVNSKISAQAVVTPKTSPRSASLSSGGSDGFFTPHNIDLDRCPDTSRFYTAVVPSRLRSLSSSSQGGAAVDWLSEDDDSNLDHALLSHDKTDRIKATLSFDSDSSNNSTCERENFAEGNKDLVTPPFVLGSNLGPTGTGKSGKGSSGSCKKRLAVEMASPSPLHNTKLGFRSRSSDKAKSLFSISTNWSNDLDDDLF
ncbi:uncharacterized protein LOC142337525 isoform X2 [Convolutriloba macropyga]|uniref:uncharacterized protein LOC142337525 isoform X2 n=1 Tax=Convolutriloba macropyga TaxID=536237 RepID=UPI003F5257E9